MSWADWLLSLHVLSGFALVGGLAALWALVLATRSETSGLSGAASQAIALPATAAVVVGTFGTLIFGVWLAIDLDAYQLWDGWIIAALVLWLVGSAFGGRAGPEFAKAGAGGPDGRAAWRRGVRLHAASSVASLLILVLMIWKPGA